jgi:hypothetical protein
VSSDCSFRKRLGGEARHQQLEPPRYVEPRVVESVTIAFGLTIAMRTVTIIKSNASTDPAEEAADEKFGSIKWCARGRQWWQRTGKACTTSCFF